MDSEPEPSFEEREATSSLRRSPGKLRGPGQGQEGLGMDAGQLPIREKGGRGRKRLCTFFPEETFAEKVVEAWKELGGVTIPYPVYQEKVLGTRVDSEVPVFVNLELLFKRKRRKYLNEPWPRNAFRMEYIRHLHHWGKTKKVQLRDFMLSPPGDDGNRKVLVKDVIGVVEELKNRNFDREDSQSQELSFPALHSTRDSRDMNAPGVVQQSPSEPDLPEPESEPIRHVEGEGEALVIPPPEKAASPLTFVTQYYLVPADRIRIKKKINNTNTALPSSSRKVTDRNGNEWVDNSGTHDNGRIQLVSAPTNVNQRILGLECSQPKRARATTSKPVVDSAPKTQECASTNVNQRVLRPERLQQKKTNPSKAVVVSSPTPKTPEVARCTRASAVKSIMTKSTPNPETNNSAAESARQAPSTSQRNRSKETSKSPNSASYIGLLDSSDDENESHIETANIDQGQNLGQDEDGDNNEDSDYSIEDSEVSERQRQANPSKSSSSATNAPINSTITRYKKSYSDQDDRLMLELIILNKWVRYVKGKSLWEFLEKKKILFGGQRPAQGMRERFVKRIIPKVGQRPCPFRFLTSKQFAYFNIEMGSAKRNQHSSNNAFVEPPLKSIRYPNKN